MIEKENICMSFLPGLIITADKTILGAQFEFGK